MQDIQLSPHFKLSEFTKSPTASARKIDNTLNPSNPEHAKIIANLSNLCEQVLEPLRVAMGVPITIGSGYRCPALNRAVGGVANSQHMTGEAADISAPTHDANGNKLSPSQSLSLLNEWFMYLMENCQFDQLIKERNTKTSKSFWIHVSFKAMGNRQHVICNLVKHPDKA